MGNSGDIPSSGGPPTANHSGGEPDCKQGGFDDESSQSVSEHTTDVPAGDSQPSEKSWCQLFPYDSPYKQQIDGIEKCQEVLSDNGFTALEGACGTGKTLIALVATLNTILNPSEVAQESEDDPNFNRVFAVTPVKQQLEQFLSDIRDINSHRANLSKKPVGALELRGKRDMLPYLRKQKGVYDGSELGHHQATQKVRQNTREIIKKGSDFPLPWPQDLDPSGGRHGDNEAGEDEDWYDPNRAEALCRGCANTGEQQLSVEGCTSPYPAEMPTAKQVFDFSKTTLNPQQGVEDGYSGYIDPFFAGYYAYDCPTLSDAPLSVMDSKTLVSASVEKGVCPYQTMLDLVDYALVLVGNYYHAFDPQTRPTFENVIGPKTALVVDEAHRLESRLRDALSDSFGMQSLNRAQNDVEVLIQILEGQYDYPDYVDDPDAIQRKVADLLARSSMGSPVNRQTLERLYHILSWVQEQLTKAVERHLSTQFGTADLSVFPASISSQEEFNMEYSEYSECMPLHSIGESPDALISSLSFSDEFTEKDWSRLFGDAAVAAKVAIEETPELQQTPTIGSVGRALTRWKDESYDEFFRLVECEYSYKTSPPLDMPSWYQHFTPQFTLFNCIPSDRLAEMFDEFGGGILMSATLAPFDVFKSVSGLSVLEEEQPRSQSGNSRASQQEESVGTNPPTVGGDSEGPAGPARKSDGHAADEVSEDQQANNGGKTTSRTVKTVQYPLSFPIENRESICVTLPPFTYENRGSPVTDFEDMSATRRRYRRALLDIADSLGNVLICLPSYGEAKWGQQILTESDSISKPVLCDESSSSHYTTQLLEEFFSGGGKVLLTSTLGTVTEGVDYHSDRLHTCAVIGVPYPYPDERRNAIEDAYSKRFSDLSARGFEIASTIPAVRKVRQAIGRVIRGEDERGVRIFVDERFSQRGRAWKHLSDTEKEEFRDISLQSLGGELGSFWERGRP
jgi:DNA excision repair protein ERCC-2